MIFTVQVVANVQFGADEEGGHVSPISCIFCRQSNNRLPDGLGDREGGPPEVCLVALRRSQADNVFYIPHCAVCAKESRCWVEGGSP